VPARWAIEALDIIEHVLPCLITRVIGLRAIRSVLSEEQKLSIAALSQTFPERLIEHMADLNMGILQRFTENVDAAVTKQAIGMPARLCPAHLKQLKLPTVLREYDKVARECARDGTDHPRYLLRLIELELIDRERRTIERRIRAARFPAVKSFDTFEFTAIPSLNKMLVRELARCEYVLRRENIIALGNSGTGKTHVALALGLAACQKGFTVTFTTAAALVSQLLDGAEGHRSGGSMNR
jgi:hypothetical protein